MLNVKNVFKTAGFMIIATLLAKLVGMYREVLFASLFGTGTNAVAYLTASRIPLLFFDITLGAAVSSSFIPVYNEYERLGDKKSATVFANSFINIIVLITGIMCVLGTVFSGQIVGLMAGEIDDPSVKQEIVLLASKLVVILFPSMIFTGVAYSLAGLLQSMGEFNIPAAISLVSNGIMVVYLHVFGKKFGIEGVAIAMLISWSFQVIVQLPALKKKGYKYRPIIDFKNEGLKKSALLALPILISSWVQPINTVVNIYLAAGLSGGEAAPALDYANKLYIIFVGVLTYAVSNLIFPSISRMAASEDKTEFKTVILKALRTVILMISLIMALFMVLRVPIVRFVYERGEFGTESTYLTAKALYFYSLGMVGYAASEILNKVFYSMQNGKTPMYVAMAGISINILLSFILIKGIKCDLGGLSLAASVASTLIAIMLFVLLNRKLKLYSKNLLVFLLKVALCAVITGVTSHFTLNVICFGDGFIGKFLTIVIPAISGGIVYVVLAFIFRIEELDELKNMIFKKRS